jgi:hypothetical protein
LIDGINLLNEKQNDPINKKNLRKLMRVLAYLKNI